MTYPGIYVGLKLFENSYRDLEQEFGHVIHLSLN